MVHVRLSVCLIFGHKTEKMSSVKGHLKSSIGWHKFPTCYILLPMKSYVRVWKDETIHDFQPVSVK